MKKSSKKDDNYIDDLVEWQENQYNPGHYTGGKIPPLYKNVGKPRVVGWLYILGSLIFVSMVVYQLSTTTSSSDDVISIIVAFILFGGIGVIYFFVGRRYLQIWRSQRRKR